VSHRQRACRVAVAAALQQRHLGADLVLPRHRLLQADLQGDGLGRQRAWIARAGGRQLLQLRLDGRLFALGPRQLLLQPLEQQASPRPG
jgi:hypothetical protein